MFTSELRVKYIRIQCGACLCVTLLVALMHDAYLEGVCCVVLLGLVVRCATVFKPDADESRVQYIQMSDAEIAESLMCCREDDKAA